MKNRENRQFKKGIFLPWRSTYVLHAHKKEGSKEEKIWNMNLTQKT